MSYKCLAKGGMIYSSTPEKVITELSDLGIDSAIACDREVDIISSQYISYDEEVFQPIADLALDGSYICFIGEDDSVWTLEMKYGAIKDKPGDILWDHQEGDIFIINYINSNGFLDGTESFPVIGFDSDEVINQAYELYTSVYKAVEEVIEDGELLSLAEFEEIMLKGFESGIHDLREYLLIQTPDNHIQFEPYKKEKVCGQ